MHGPTLNWIAFLLCKLCSLAGNKHQDSIWTLREHIKFYFSKIYEILNDGCACVSVVVRPIKWGTRFIKLHVYVHAPSTIIFTLLASSTKSYKVRCKDDENAKRETRRVWCLKDMQEKTRSACFLYAGSWNPHVSPVETEKDGLHQLTSLSKVKQRHVAMDV